MTRFLNPGPSASGAARGPVDSATLLTAIPALLGFVPERSIIVVAFGADSSIRATMRHDLALDADGSPLPGLSAVLADLGEITAGYDAEEIVVILADDRYPADDLRYRRVLAVADRAFTACGGVRVGYGLAEFDAGTPWSVTWHPDGPLFSVRSSAAESGVLGDPHSCPTAIAAAVRSGRRILRRRSEMREMLEPLDDECGIDRRLESCAASAHRGTSPLLSGAAALRLVLGIVVEGRSPDCAELDPVATALVHLDVRDALMALAVTDLRDSAEKLWRELTRRLSGPARASAATLLAHLHYIGGEGAYAGVALDCALTEDPDWKMAGLLDTALRAGVRPTMLWEMVAGCYDVAAGLGVSLPAATLRAAG